MSERKKLIRDRFSRAADTYDSHADIQAELAQNLASTLSAGFPPCKRVLELGCGTGNYTGALCRQFPEARIVALDFSEAMLLRARTKVASGAVSFLCADAETFLAAAEADFDLITTNAVMHWFEDQATAVGNIRRLLDPGGVFLASIYGPATLHELGAGLAHVYGDDKHVAADGFLAVRPLRDLLDKHFRKVAVERKLFVRQYHSLHELLHQIRATGTSGGGLRSEQPLTRGGLVALAEWFEAELGGYPATYEVYMVRCTK